MNRKKRTAFLTIAAVAMVLALALPPAFGQLAGPTGAAPPESTSTQPPVPDWTFAGPATGPKGSVGDLNGDGFDDVMILDTATSQWRPTIARIFAGSPTGLGAAESWTIENRWLTCPAGDVNGDGFDDVFAGGIAGLQVFYGSSAEPVAGATWTEMHNSLSTAGDVNGDGYADLLVGDSTYSNDLEMEGRLLLYYGSAAGPAPTPDWTAEGNAVGRGLGTDVWAIGDANGDGYDDFAAAGPRYSSGRWFAIYLGSPTGPVAQPGWTPAASAGWYSFSAAGDINGDGHDDVVVGIPGFNQGAGQARVYQGSPDGLGQSPDWTYPADNTPSHSIGSHVAGAGDVNGDGYADLLIDGPVLRAFLGSTSGLPTSPPWTAALWAGAPAGDVNGDGYGDILAGSGQIAGFYGSAAGLDETTWLVRPALHPPVIDGDLGEWEPEPRYALDLTSAETLTGTVPSAQDAGVAAQARWDSNALYLALRVSDDALVDDSPEVWNDDEIEMAFVGVYDGDPAGGDTHQYTVNADGRISDFGDPSAPIPVESAVVAVPGGWNVEMRIPASHLFGLIAFLYTGEQLSFNLGLHDDDDGGAWDSYLVLNGASTASGEGYGTMILVTAAGYVLPTPTAMPSPTATPSPTPTPTASRTPTPTPIRSPTPTPTITPTPTDTPPLVPWPDLSTSSKVSWPTAVHAGQPVLYNIRLINMGAPAEVSLVDAPPLPYFPDTAWGGLVWDAETRTLRWQGTVDRYQGLLLGYTLEGPAACVPPGTVLTNTLTIDDGYHPPFVRSVAVVVAAGATPVASCTPTATSSATATATPTVTPTATVTPTPLNRYLPLIMQ